LAAAQLVGAAGIACATAVVQATTSSATMTAGTAHFALVSIG